MSLIKARNEFGNLVTINYDLVQSVKEKNGVFQVLYPLANGQTRLLFLEQPNKPALLKGFEARSNQETQHRSSSTKKGLMCRTNSRSLIMNRVPYVKVFESHT